MLRLSPTREEFRARCGSGAVPIAVEIFADHMTPLSAFAALSERVEPAGLPHAYLLESVVGGEKWARWSFVGVEPDLVLRARGRTVVLERSTGRETIEGDPLDVIDRVMAPWRPAPGPLPAPRFWGGAVGWLGWDLVRGIEPIGDRLPPGDQDDVLLAIGGTVLAFDHLRQTATLLYTPPPGAPGDPDAIWEAAVTRLERMADRLRVAAPLRALTGRVPTVPARPISASFDEAGFVAAVERALEYVRAGDVIQVVLSQQMSLPRDHVAPLEVYRMLRLLNPSPYMFYVSAPDVQIVGASPEILVRRTGDAAELRPIAGTRQRGATEDEDAALERELLVDPKERAEHVMLVDLGRNDLGRLAVPGGVEVTDRMVVERYSHVMHLVSHVRARLRPGLRPADVIRATFPAGTLSGAPKVRAMQIIEELEPQRRGLYGGAVGWIGWNGDLDLAITIRTVEARRDELRVQVGAGIVYDSVPAREWQETIDKSRACLLAIAGAR